MRPKPSLRAELLFNLAFLASAALLLGVVTVLLIEAVTPGIPPRELAPLVLAALALDVAVFIVFGGYLVRRHVLRPVERLVRAADAVAAGDLAARAPEADTRDFSLLAERLNRMTDRLLDAQGRLVQSEKLASIGGLAAGIAHEVGNPLGALGTYADVLARRGADPEVLAGMRRELDRIDRIVRSLLDYARPRDAALQAIDPAAAARAAHDLLEAQGALNGVTVRLELEPVPPVRAGAHALEQAFVNLLLNAAEAAAGGTVTLGVRSWAFEAGRARPRRASDPPGAVFPRAAGGDAPRDFAPGTPGVLLYVADSGPGVPAADRARVFEPFFTTKDPGRGTGLGLAIVARTVHGLGGVVWVEPAREGGAAFKLFFPRDGA